MPEIVTLEGPLDEERLQWVIDLYGEVDAKYRRRDILQHLLEQSPAGPALHAFAVEGGRGVGHCCVVPLPARRGSEPIRSGKLEALVVEKAFRGRRGTDEPVVLSLLARLYELADERGIEVVHAYVTPAVGRVTGFVPVEVGRPTLVAVVSPEDRGSRTRLWMERALAPIQRFVRALTGVGRPPAELRPAESADVDLLPAAPPPDAAWTSLAEDAWDWYRASPIVRVLALGGDGADRALVQVPGAPGEPVRLIGWRPSRAGVRPALQLLAALGATARASGAGTLRVQLWGPDVSSRTLNRACLLTGFVPRKDMTTLWVRARDHALERPDRIVATPLFYLGF
jgi:hypothetical protein